ncbi:MAG: hypothetical protein ABSH08_05975 [Tepidisphaeraceae bacterium]
MRQKPNSTRRQHPNTGGGCAAPAIHPRQGARPQVMPDSKRNDSPKRAKSKGALPTKIFGAGTILDRRWGHLL